MSNKSVADHSPSRNEAIGKIRELVKGIDFAMLTTIESDGTLRSRPMSLNNEVEFDGDLWFFTRVDTAKVDEVERDSHVCAAFSNPKKQEYVSLSGRAQVVRDRAKIKELWQPQLKAWFPDGSDDPQVALLHVVVEQGEYWDSPASPVAHLIGLVKAIATGTPANVGENEKVNL